MKKRFRITAFSFVGIVCVTIALIWIYDLFAPKRVQDLLRFQLSEITDYTILEHTSTKSSRILEIDDVPLIETLNMLEIGYRGQYDSIMVKRPQKLYELSLIRKMADDYQELGKLMIAENGYIYFQGDKYKILTKTPCDTLLDLLCSHVF